MNQATEIMTNEQLVSCVKSGGEPACESMLQLWSQNQGIINIFVRKFTGTAAEEEDLRQEAYIALCDAVANYQSASGSFIHYLCFWLKQRMIRYCEKNVSGPWIPINQRAILRKMRKQSEIFEQRFSRSPTFRELFAMTGVPQRNFRECYLLYYALAPARLDAPVSTSEDETISMVDTLPDGKDMADDVIDREFREEMREAVTQELEKLPEDQKKAISLVHLEGMPQWKAGEIMGLEGWQVGNLIRKGFKKLNGTPAKRLRPYICDDALSAAYRGSFTRFRNSWISATENAAIINMSH